MLGHSHQRAGRWPLLARMRPTGRANQCPQLGVERTQCGRHLWAVHDPNRSSAPLTGCKMPAIPA